MIGTSQSPVLTEDDDQMYSNDTIGMILYFSGISGTVRIGEQFKPGVFYFEPPYRLKLDFPEKEQSYCTTRLYRVGEK